MADKSGTQRRVLVTGGSRGIGAAVVTRYRQAGWEVVAPKRSALDLAATDSVQAWLEGDGAVEFDALVNNAGENRVKQISELSLADWHRIQTVNLTSALLLIQSVSNGMAVRGWGRIVNISSIYGFLARPGRASYSASKAALASLTRTAALEYGSANVLVNAVCPGFVETEMTRHNNSPEQIKSLCENTALKRLAQPAEVANFVYWLGSEENTYLTGQSVVIDGGFSIQ